MQTTEGTVVWVQVRNHVVSVDNVRAGQTLMIVPTTADCYGFHFDFDTGFADKGHLELVQDKQRVENRLGDLNKPSSNQNLLTWKDTLLYNTPVVSSVPFSALVINLCYPILSRLKNRPNQTWFQARIGDRLTWVSNPDAQEDNGIPVLAYYYILRDGRNTRLRHTSITTSVCAFNNQMTWLRDQGYTMLIPCRLEDYVRNKINLPTRTAVITFDDSLKSVNRYARPALGQYGFHVTAFIISSRIKRHPQKWDLKSLQFMSVSEPRQIQDVFDIQSYTHFPYRIDAGRRPILSSRSYHNTPFDFAHSRRMLSQFNPHVLYLSHPFGDYNATVVQAVNDARFHMAATTVRGKAKPGDNSFLLRRLYILRTDSLETMS